MQSMHGILARPLGIRRQCVVKALKAQLYPSNSPEKLTLVCMTNKDLLANEHLLQVCLSAMTIDH